MGCVLCRPRLQNAHTLNSLIPCLLKIVKDLVNSVWAWVCLTSTQKDNLTRNPGCSFKFFMTTKAWISKILRSKEVISTVPQNFPDKVPLVCYHNTPTVSPNLLNFREESQAVGKGSGSLSCDYHSSRFNYSPLGHVVTGDLNIVSNPKLRDLSAKPQNIAYPER